MSDDDEVDTKPCMKFLKNSAIWLIGIPFHRKTNMSITRLRTETLLRRAAMLRLLTN